MGYLVYYKYQLWNDLRPLSPEGRTLRHKAYGGFPVVRIGIVDDEKEAREQLRAAIKRFEEENHVEFAVQEYDSAQAYLADPHNDCDILYMDIDMPKMTGMELAERIRETNGEIILIFCTNLEQFALNGYSVSALGFLVKPVQWYSLRLYLDRALKVLRKREQRAREAQARRIVIKNGAVSKVTDAASIRYVEVQQHYLFYHMLERDGEAGDVLKIRGTMQEAADLLELRGFVRCSSSFLVNLEHITAVSRMNVYLGEDVLPLGRTYKDAFTREFSRFLAKKGWGDPC